MASRCAFCNQAICWGEVTEGGKIFHEKCTPSARGVTNTAALEQQKELEKRKEEFQKQPKVIGGVEIEESSEGFTIDPITGEKKPLKAGQRFANPRVGKK